MYASTCMPGLPHHQHPPPDGIFLTTGEPPLTHHHHPKAMAYITVHAWYWTSYGFGQMYTDIMQSCNLQSSLLALNPPFLSNAGPGASHGSWKERECMSRPLPGRGPLSEGTAAQRVGVISALQMRPWVRVELGLVCQLFYLGWCKPTCGFRP